ncbi:MAG: hypothetical protein O7C75_20600 [Verrucomicrobia bacterium]|nr:hypothetical protein [Verrucomicrobiota bacterium]
MRTKSPYYRIFGLTTLAAVLFVGPISAEDDKPNSRYSNRTPSNQSNSGQSSRWGDRLNQLKQQQSRGSSSSSSSSNYRNTKTHSGSNTQTGSNDIGRGNRDFGGSRSGNDRDNSNLNRTGGTSRPERNTGRIIDHNRDRDRIRGIGGTSHPDRNYGSVIDHNRDRNHGSDYDRDRNFGNDHNRDHNYGSGNSYNHDRDSGRSIDHNHYLNSRSGNYSIYGSNHDYYRDRNYYGHDPYGYNSSRYSSSRYYNRRSSIYPIYGGIVLGTLPSQYGSYVESQKYGSGSSSLGYVVFYEHAGYRGDNLELRAGQSIFNLRDFKKSFYSTFNDRISSFRVFGEVTVILHRDAYFKGDNVYLYGSVIDFTEDGYLRKFNDEVSSIEIVPGIFDEHHNVPATEGGYGNSAYGSIQAPVGLEASSYPNYQSSSTGAPVILDRSSSPGRSQSVARIFLYDQPNFQGNQFVMLPGSAEVDLSRLSKGGVGTWDDSIASIRVEGGAEVFLYTNAEFRGEGIALNESVPEISAGNGLNAFAQEISSVVVNAAP